MPAAATCKPDALRRGHQFAASAVHLDAQLADVLADFGAGLDDGLVHLALDLLDDVRRSGGKQLHDVRTQLARGWIDDLEFFFYADGKAVSHGVALRAALVSLGTGRRYHTPRARKLHLLNASCLAVSPIK